MNYKQLKKLMGKIVLVSEIFELERDDKKRGWTQVKLEKPRPGWIVGIRFLQTGVVENSFLGGTWAEPEYYERSYLSETEPRKLCALVAFTPTEKHFKVVPDSLIETNEKPYYNPYPMDDEYKKMLSECAKEQPRDINGRFVK